MGVFAPPIQTRRGFYLRIPRKLFLSRCMRHTLIEYWADT